MKLNFKLIILFASFVIISCNSGNQKKTDNTKNDIDIEINGDIISTIINEPDNFFYIDFKKYPNNLKQLPIGIFDSGTGGLTVLKAIVNFDQYNNSTFKAGRDGQIDFEKESFIYLGDQANMPYGNYAKENKVDLLKEHIIKDAQFLLGNKYYESQEKNSYKEDKQPVKVIVVACNTATAYGKTYIEEFLSKGKANIKVIGVIDAGVRGALQNLGKNEDAIIGVMATAGTVASKGYKRTIETFSKKLEYTGNIEVFQQGGVGIAEAVDEDTDYFIKGIKAPRDNYKGPGLSGDVKIDKTLLDIYNFNFDNGKMLCDTKNLDDCTTMQINDADNYVRYHVVTLLENIRLSGTKNKLKSIILGCTHYPYLTQEIHQVLNELYNYQTQKGEFIYRKNMDKKIVLIDPAVNTAKELYEHLNASDLMNSTGDIHTSEFYISVTNGNNNENIINADGNFPYEYKYGREPRNIQEYVKVVPFSRANISSEILGRFQKQLPFVYKLIEEFNATNSKTSNLTKLEKI